ALHPGAARLLDEAGDAVGAGVNLDAEFDVEPFALAQPDEAVEYSLPVLVAREVVVGDDEAADSLREVRAHYLLYVVGRAPARLTPLHVDDRAERAREGAATP